MDSKIRTTSTTVLLSTARTQDAIKNADIKNVPIGLTYVVPPL